MRALLGRAKTFFEKHERLLSAGALLFGFIVDSLTLRRIDLLAENIVLISYILVVALCIVVLAFEETHAPSNRLFLWSAAVAPFVMQAVFGGLFSAFVIFYSRSASLSASWPFMLFLVGMLVGNEAFRPHYKKLVFHVSIFFVGLLSYCLFLVPVVTRSIGTLTFLGSIFLALACISLFIGILFVIGRARIRKSRHFLVRSIGAITALVLFAYAANSIPPVPLALKDSVVAHTVNRSGDVYTLTTEPRSIADYVRRKEIYHRTAHEPVYVWTSVFAPTRLSTAVVHEWQYRQDKEWVTTNRVVFPITGGRDDGFRGYSQKTNLFDGAWRVSVETERGQVIGRVRFDVVSGDAPSEQKVIVR